MDGTIEENADVSFLGGMFNQFEAGNPEGSQSLTLHGPNWTETTPKNPITIWTIQGCSNDYTTQGSLLNLLGTPWMVQALLSPGLRC